MRRGLTHVPPEQTWFWPQATPQAPQLFLSPDRLTQAPLQAVKEALKEMPHVEPEQVAAPLAGTGQALAQAPQSATFDLRSTQAPPQLAKPTLQEMPHVELEQVAVPLAGAGQAWPQEAQFWGSVVVSAQLPLQFVGVGAWQEVTHAPPEQSWFATHGMPQPPQLALSLCVLTQAPPQSV